MNVRTAVAAAVLALASAGTLLAQEQKREAAEEAEHTLRESQVPAAVRDAFRHAYPNARVTKYTSERENGRTVYEVESVDGTVHRDLLIGADGAILETETQVTPAQLPAPVRTAAQANGARIDKAEIVVAGRDTTYEMVIHGRHGELKGRVITERFKDIRDQVRSGVILGRNPLHGLDSLVVLRDTIKCDVRVGE